MSAVAPAVVTMSRGLSTVPRFSSLASKLPAVMVTAVSSLTVSRSSMSSSSVAEPGRMRNSCDSYPMAEMASIAVSVTTVVKR